MTRQVVFSSRFATLALLGFVIGARAVSGQPTFEIVHEFRKEPPRQPTSAPVEGPDGSLYGTAYRGGDFGKGAIYRLRPGLDGAWSFETVHSFEGPDGQSPFANLVLGADGDFYGVTPWGGESRTGSGTAFKMTPDGVLTTLHSFSQGLHNPVGALVEGHDGFFYGTTMFGGSHGEGTFFRISPSGVFAIIAWSFNLRVAQPAGRLVQGPDGDFYGTSLYGLPSAIGGGAVFRMTPDGVVAWSRRFTEPEGVHPTAGLLPASDGSFWGTTYRGGEPLGTGSGTVFRITPSGTLETLHVFTGEFGRHPFAALVEASDGNVYGTTAAAGGTVFRIAPTRAVTLLHSFKHSGDALPVSSLTEAGDGFLYGTTYFGGDAGVPDHRGTIYRIGLDGAFETVYQFQEAVREAYDGVVQGSDGHFYGTAFSSTPGTGLIYRVSPSGEFTRLSSSAPGQRVFPSRLSQAKDGKFYGTTFSGGLSGKGTIFRMTAAGAVEFLHHFRGDDGASPVSAPIEASDGRFYGTTLAGGAGGRGTVYKWTPAGLSVVYSFFGPDGASPAAALLESDDGNFYGMTEAGGANGEGTVFRITPSGLLTTLHAFTGFEGDGYGTSVPLIQGEDGNFYGISQTQFGSLFRTTAAGQFTTVHRFQLGGFLGCSPQGLIQASDGNFYVPIRVSFFCADSVFRVTPGGDATVIYEVDSSTEGEGISSLIEGRDGALYGTLSSGGQFGRAGAVFRLVLH